MDASDTKLHLAYDQRWRIRGVFEDSDSAPTEEFLYHAAGLDGGGSSSYIDSVILRDRDTTGNGTLDERVYYVHNWRNDVVALISDTGSQVEGARYSSYGIPFGIPAGDVDGSGAVVTADTDQIQTWIDAPAYDVRGDLDLDGDVDAADKTAATNNFGASGSWGVLSDSSNDNRKGYAGYEFDNGSAAKFSLYHVRNRILNADFGRWMTRDQLGYVDGMNVYGYVKGNPVDGVDPSAYCAGGWWIKPPQSNPIDIPPLNPGPLRSDPNALDCCKFWIQQGDTSWTNPLPPCPCSESNIPPDWEQDPYLNVVLLHNGADACHRSPPAPNGATQQCCYDSSDQLITYGQGAGTPDKNQPGGHTFEDVVPFLKCKAAGLINCYHDVRPPSFIPCVENPVNETQMGAYPCACPLVIAPGP